VSDRVIENRQSERVADVWDAGDLGCGDLVLELRGRLRAIPGRVLRVIAFDPGAPEDIPAWCRLTGHALVHQEEATSSYWIRARGESEQIEAAARQGVKPASDVDEIYSPRVFQLARSLPDSSQLAAPDATATAESKLCGSTIAVEIAVSAGGVQAYAQRVKACLFGRATAAVVARKIVGTSLAELQEVSRTMRAMLEAGGPPPVGRWAELAALAPVRALKGRHASTLLVFVALERAVASLPNSSSECCGRPRR
jgi:NifU-like protein involved in Fe-S cluster formation/TusA-related sulfurtransferase